jgi:hypothetical protein
MENEFKTKYLNFLINFNKYGEQYQNIYNTVKNIELNKSYIIKLVEYFENNNIEDFKIFSKTNLKDIWEDLDQENKLKYQNDLQDVIDFGKLLSLRDIVLNNIGPLNENENKEEEKSDELDISKYSKMIENIEPYLKQFLGKGNDLNKIFEIVQDEIINLFPKHIESIKKIVDNINIKEKLEEYVKLIEEHVNIDEITSIFNNISTDMNNPKLLINGIIQKVNELKNNENIIKVGQIIIEDVKKILNEHNVPLEELINFDTSKVYKIITNILNKLNIDVGKFEFIKLILKQFNIKPQQKTKEDKKAEKEKRRAKKRCAYRKKLRSQLNKKKRNRR